MAHFAKVLNGKVVDVIVAEQDFIDNMIDETPGEWIQTSYNTYRGVHRDGGTPLRGNFAGIGYTYDADLDVFIQPCPHKGWVQDNSIFDWVPPTPHPDDGNPYVWDDETESWVAADPQPE